MFVFTLLIAAAAWSAPLSDQSGCGTPPPAERAREACAIYSLDERIAAEPTAQNALRACLDFYTGASEALNIVCSYRTEAQLLQARAASEGEAAVNEEARLLLADAAARMTEKFARLENENRDYGRALAAFSRVAHDQATREATCTSVSAAAPGVLLAGVAQAANLDRVAAYRPLKELSGVMADQSLMAYWTAGSVVGFLQNRGGDLGAVMPQAPCGVTPIERGEVGSEPRRPGFFGAEVASRNGQTVFNQHVTKPLVQLYNPAANRFLTSALGSSLNLGNRVLKTGGKLDLIDYASVGSNLLVQAGKATLMRAHVSAFVLQGIEHLVRQYQYTNYRGRAYAAFAKTYLEERPASSSAELAAAFAKETGGRHCAR